MLIRPVTLEDIPSWVELAKDVAPIFRSPNMPKKLVFY